MRRALWLTLTSLFVCLVPSSVSVAKPKPPLAFVERVLNAAADARLPLVIAMHGLGSTPESLLELFDGFDQPVRVVAPRAPDPWSVGSSWYPIDAPDRAPPVVKRRAVEVLALIDRVKKQRPTLGLPVVTGFSQGGVLSFALAAYHPERLGAAVPMAGWLWPSMTGFRKAPAGFRVVALHGKDDHRIRYAQGEQTVARLREAGTDATLLGFDGVDHYVSPEMRVRYHQTLREALAKLRGQ
ncbi:MAG: dienelactone hydrolase family protein [Polyangiales bacterium]